MSTSRSFIALLLIIPFAIVASQTIPDSITDLPTGTSIDTTSSATDVPPLDPTGFPEGTATQVPGAPLSTGIPIDMCDVNDLQCCTTARPEDDTQVNQLLTAFDVDTPGDPNALVGVLCSNMTGGIDESEGNLCSGDTQMPLCCADSSYDGVFALECIPIEA